MSSSPPVPSQHPRLPRDSSGFRLRREIGRGGMGVVYEAQEISTGRTVALKVLLQELVVSDEAMERFQREARLAAAISHARCVFVFGAHSVEGSPAIAMELIGGETLEDRIRRGEPIPVETAVRWAIDILDGLEAAHRAGVLHRDVKPSNCFITTDGRVKVGDFGLSRSLERDIQLTQTGQFLGSPLYASPEQVRGRALDERSDLYSCGATLYAMLTGQPPFSGSNVGEVLARILSEEPTHPRSIRPGIPRGLETVVLRAMERAPEKRWRDLHEFREALEPFATASEAVAPRWRRIVAYILDQAANQLLIWPFVFLAKLFGAHPFVVGASGNIRPSPIGHVVTGLAEIAYFGLAEGLLGFGLGKWLLGLRVVAEDSREPSLVSAFMRAAVFLAPTVLLMTLLTIFVEDSPARSMLQLGVTALMYVLLFSTARRSNGWRGVHGFVSRTVVLPVSLPFLRARLREPPPETAIESGPQLPDRLGEYDVEGVVGQTSAGRILKARDTRLERSVWIHVPQVAGALAGEERRALARPGRLRWLGVVPTPAGEGDVFESPGGSSLPALVTRLGRLDWPNAQRLLLALVEELSVDTGDGMVAGRSLEQVWIDRNWDLRLLDEPVGHPPFARHPPLGLVRESARSLFLGTQEEGYVLPPDLPLHAEESVSRLISADCPYESLTAARDALVRISAGPTKLPRRTRGAQLSINVFLPAIALGVLVGFGVLIGALIAESRGVPTMLSELDSGRIELADAEATEADRAPELGEDARAAREILVARTFESVGGRLIRGQQEPRNLEIIDASIQHHPSPDAAEIARAEQVVRDGGGESARQLQEAPSAGGPFMPALVIALSGVSLWGLFALPMSLFLRGGLMPFLFGVRVRNRRGLPASRMLCLLRCLLCWLPVFAGIGGPLLLMSGGGSLLPAIIASITVVVWLAAVVDAVVHPAQTVVDRLLKTRLVPR